MLNQIVNRTDYIRALIATAFPDKTFPSYEAYLASITASNRAKPSHHHSVQNAVDSIDAITDEIME